MWRVCLSSAKFSRLPATAKFCFTYFLTRCLSTAHTTCSRAVVHCVSSSVSVCVTATVWPSQQHCFTFSTSVSAWRHQPVLRSVDVRWVSTGGTCCPWHYTDSCCVYVSVCLSVCHMLIKQTTQHCSQGTLVFFYLNTWWNSIGGVME